MNDNKYPVYPAIVLSSILDCYGPPLYFYPKKEVSMSAKEYDIFKKEFYDEYFEKFEGENDLETLMNLWNFMVEKVEGIDPNYEEVLNLSKEESLNNKKVQELFKIVRQCCKILAIDYGKDINIGPFNPKKVFKYVEPFLIKSYDNFIFKNTSGNQYINQKNKEYFKLDRRQAVNITNNYNPSKLIALRTAEIAGTDGRSSNVISLYVPTS